MRLPGYYYLMRLRTLAFDFVILRLAADAIVPDFVHGAAWSSVTRTGAELSIVCPADDVPATSRPQQRWRCFEVIGPLDLHLVGVLQSIAEPLARAGVSIFAISTFDTDYVLVRAEQFDVAATALARAGHMLEDVTGGQNV